jgi:hypothetical protein
MQKPVGITVTATLICISLVTNTVLVFAKSPITGKAKSTSDLLIGLAIQSLTAVIVWFYYQGQNWARWLVILQAAVSIVTGLSSSKEWQRSHFGGAAYIYDALLGVFLLVYLNTMQIRSWFNRPTTEK